MRLLNIILVIFFVLTNEIKADNEIQVLENLKRGGNLIFIRHAYAPGGEIRIILRLMIVQHKEI